MDILIDPQILLSYQYFNLCNKNKISFVVIDVRSYRDFSAQKVSIKIKSLSKYLSYHFSKSLSPSSLSYLLFRSQNRHDFTMMILLACQAACFKVLFLFTLLKSRLILPKQVLKNVSLIMINCALYNKTFNSYLLIPQKLVILIECVGVVRLKDGRNNQITC